MAATPRKIMAVPGMCPGEVSLQLGSRASWAKDDSDLMWISAGGSTPNNAFSALKRIARRYKAKGFEVEIVTEEQATANHGWTPAAKQGD